MDDVNNMHDYTNPVPFGVISDILHCRILNGSQDMTDEQLKQESNSQSNSDIPTIMSPNTSSRLPPLNISNDHAWSSFGQNYDFGSRPSGATLQKQDDMTQQSADWTQIFHAGACSIGGATDSPRRL
jgi:hypothetical protein